MSLTDEQLLLLEQITYIKGNVSDAAGVCPSGDTVGDWLSCFTEDVLTKLENTDVPSGKMCFMSGKEWAAIIRALKSDKALCSLKIVDYNPHVGAFCFEDANHNHIVAFKGTLNGDEWIDNFKGLYMSDTQSQLEALDYIESLGYDDITVVGHSKGGNKAMYVAITSDSVSRCVSMDGQGFSQEFLDKYAAEIAEKGGNINNYSLSTDFVHILLFPIPNSGQHFFISDSEYPNGARNHAPGAYFWFESYVGKDGKTHFRISESGKDGYKYIVPGAENQGMHYLHEFTCFILNNMPDDRKRQMAEYLGIIAAISLTDNYKIEINGTIYSKENLKDFITSYPECMSLLFAYLLKFAEINNLTAEELGGLLAAFLPKDFLEQIAKALIPIIIRHPIISAAIGSIVTLYGANLIAMLGALLVILYRNLKDGKPDPWIEKLLHLLGESLNLNVNLDEIWRNTEREYHDISINPSKPVVGDVGIAQNRVFDYSAECYNSLISAINSINGYSQSVSSWSNYSGESWYSSLFISNAIRGINGYFTHLTEINDNCKSQIDTIFANIRRIDIKKAKMIRSCIDTVNAQNNAIRKI